MLRVLDIAARDFGRLLFSLLILAVCWFFSAPMIVVFGIFAIWTLIHAVAVTDLILRGEQSRFYGSWKAERLKRYAGRKS